MNKLKGNKRYKTNSGIAFPNKKDDKDREAEAIKIKQIKRINETNKDIPAFVCISSKENNAR